MPRSVSRVRGRRKSRARARPVWRGLSAIVGLLVASTVVPIAALRVVPPPTTAFMLASQARDPATGEPCTRVDYRWRPRAEIHRNLPRAVVVAEDQRFLEHAGFDTRAIGAALDEYVAGGGMRGASTITQQVAKNLFLWPGRSLLRKGLEAWLTIFLELLWPKQRILEVYVNVAQFGPCLFGAEAAGLRYFGVHASGLSERQAALLAAVLPAPGRMRPGDPGPFTRQRAQEIVAELRRVGDGSYLAGL
ncbi:MAG: monofunctional biosynthetic peptidoglycan transglycosylase [Myxococcales bacterium]|nr:monofunctional biosynthetic peptidoglycan transglycosylase [Myxococcales bacterium]